MAHFIAWMYIFLSIGGMLLTLELIQHTWWWCKAWLHTRHAPASSASRDDRREDADETKE